MQARTAVAAFFLMAWASGGAWAGTVGTAVYGMTKDGATVHVFTMTNNHGMRAQVLDYGGIVCAVEAPGRDGKMANVILCQKDLKGIEATGPMSALTGRYANRLLHGFTLDAKHYDLQANPAGVTLHGGPPPYSRRILQTVGTFQVTAIHPGISSVSFAPSSVAGGNTSTGTVTFLATSIRASYTKTPPKLTAAIRDSSALSFIAWSTSTTRRPMSCGTAT